MPSQDCLYIRLSGYLEARRHAPDGDQASTVIVDRQAPCSREAGPEQQDGSDDREH